MEKYIIDERTGWEYELHGEQYYPTGRVIKNGTMMSQELPEEYEPEEEKHAGVWGQQHLRYIRQYNKRLYLDLCMSGKLNVYLAAINAQAEDFFLLTVKEMAAHEGVNEALKAKDQMRWIGLMNNIRNCVSEIVIQEFICR